jgi:hypothetical protein
LETFKNPFQLKDFSLKREESSDNIKKMDKLINDVAQAEEEAYRVNQTKKNISNHPIFKTIRDLGDQLSIEGASRLYDSVETLGNILVGQVAFCSGCVGVNNPELQKLSMQGLEEASMWADYVGTEREKYLRARRIAEGEDW